MASPNLYTRGQQAKLTADYKDVNGVLTDPTTPTVKVRKPDGSVVADSPVRDTTGQYHYVVTLDTDGVWAYRFESSGNLTTASEATLIVKRSAFGNGS